MTKDTTLISLTLPAKLLRQIEKVAEVYSQDRQEVIRTILTDYFIGKEAEKKEA